jgi:hypothetical protein
MDGVDVGPKPHAMAYHQGSGRVAHHGDGPRNDDARPLYTDGGAWARSQVA